MNLKTMCAVAVPLVLLCGCDPEGDGGGGGGSGTLECPAFAQITGGTFTRTAEKLEWTLTVKDLPAELTFNKTGFPQDVLEYQWGVHVDAASDGEEDYLVAVSRYAYGDEVTGDILTHTQHDLWSVDGALGSTIGSVDVTITGDTFTFTLDATEDAGLAEITESSGHRFETFYAESATDTCQDEKAGLD